MVSLAKLFLLLDPVEPIRIQEVEFLERQGHGLKEIDVPDDPEHLWRLEDCSVEVTADRKRTGIQPRGVFPQLANRLIPGGAKAWLGEQIVLQSGG
jgi:hypothetical protein